MREKAKFILDKNKCIKCDACINTCTGMVLKKSTDGYPHMIEFEKFGWNGCWKCQHCLAVCPEGAISIFGKNPEDSNLMPEEDMGIQMERLVTGRRACRRYLDKNVDPKIIDKILYAMQNVPAGGNSNNVEYTVIDDKEEVRRIWEVAYNKMEQDAKKGIYTDSFNKFYYDKMKESEKSVRKDDMLFCGAPHLFIAHTRWFGKWGEDYKINCNIATAYFELLAQAHGLGAIIMSYPSDVINDNPEIKKMLGIPEKHYMKLIVGFGYPEIKYHRKAQKEWNRKVSRFSDKTLRRQYK
ncbi:MAG: nitroreductase [Erysipelotrichaceae bacterium]|nr:nitroreductase [Erysipelotrichaceae bacterium]